MRNKQLGDRAFHCPSVQLRIAPTERLCSNDAMGEQANPGIGEERAALLRKMPSVDELMLRPRIAALTGRLDRPYVVEIVREALKDIRRGLALRGRVF